MGALAAAVVACASCSGNGTESTASGGAESTGTGGAHAVTLDDLLAAPVPKLCEHEPGNLANGTLPMQDPFYGFVSIATKANSDQQWVAFGDLDGDGVDDGALVTSCSAGGVPWPATVQLYTEGPTRLGGVDLSDVTHGREYVTDISISDGVAHVAWITQGPDEPACCGTVKMAGDLRATDGQVVMENVHRTN